MRRRLFPLLLLMALGVTLGACEKKEEVAPATSEQTAPPAVEPGQNQAAEPQQAGNEPPPSTDAAAAATVAGYQIDLSAGERINNEVCSTCHAQGLAGAPKTGDASAWQARIDKGMETLIQHSIEGFQGNQGVMPPRGGVQSLSDADVASAVVYMVQQSK